MASPLKFGNRPLLSSGTNSLPDTLHTSAMGYDSRVSHSVSRFLARSVTSHSISELMLQASMRSLMMLPLMGKGLAARQAESASGDVLQEETRRVMKGRFKRESRMNVLMGSRTPISLVQAREIYNEALTGQYRGSEQLLWNAVLRFHEEADAEEVRASLQELLAQTLPEAMVQRLNEFDAARQQGEVAPEEFADLFQNPDADGEGSSSLQTVVKRVRDITLIDLFIANGARLGVPDDNGETELDVARNSGDYFLASKLKLALNYQTLKDRADDTAPECSIVAYQFDEEKMSYEAAARKLFQHLNKSPQPYTHGALVCRHEDGRVTSRLVHSSCPLRDDTAITSVRGDLCVPEFARQVRGMSERLQVLPRRPLHQAESEPSSSFSQVSNPLLWGGVKGLQYGLLSYVVENPVAASASGICAAMTGILQAQDNREMLTAEKFGRLLGGSVGVATGVPFLGAQIGDFLIHCLKPLSRNAIHAIAEECEHNEDAIDGLLMTGGVLYVANTAGEYVGLSMGTLQTLYGMATGVVMPTAMFARNMENPRFRKFAAAVVLLSFTGLGAAAVCALAGETALLSSAYGVAGGIANSLTSSLPTLRGILLVQGALSYCQWDVRKLLSIVGSAKNLMARAVSSGRALNPPAEENVTLPDTPRQETEPEPEPETETESEQEPGSEMDDPDLPSLSTRGRYTRASRHADPGPSHRYSPLRRPQHREGDNSQMSSYRRRSQNLGRRVLRSDDNRS